MAHKHKNRKSKVAHTKDRAREKTAKRHKVFGWEAETEGFMASGRRRPTRRGGRGGCTTCR